MPPMFSGEEIRWLLHATRHQESAAGRRLMKAGAPYEYAHREEWVGRYGGLKVKLEQWLREVERG